MRHSHHYDAMEPVRVPLPDPFMVKMYAAMARRSEETALRAELERLREREHLLAWNFICHQPHDGEPRETTIVRMANFMDWLQGFIKRGLGTKAGSV